MTRWADLFTRRQLAALTTFSDLVSEAREIALQHAIASRIVDDSIRLRDGGSGATGYADALATYLAFVVDRAADDENTREKS
jgi:putative DNA methylase